MTSHIIWLSVSLIAPAPKTITETTVAFPSDASMIAAAMVSARVSSARPRPAHAMMDITVRTAPNFFMGAARIIVPQMRMEENV